MKKYVSPCLDVLTLQRSASVITTSNENVFIIQSNDDENYVSQYEAW